jgi:3-oxoacyl-[acyl-carrier protein] reductase
VKDMVGHVQRTFGRIDYLVNCAGVTRFIPFSDLDALTDEVWNEILRVNVLGAFYCARAAAGALRESHGAIVNITSVAAHRASGSSLPYSVSKAAELQLTKGLAVSLAPEVRVNAVSPGLVATRWHTARQSAEDMARQIERVASATPLQRVSTPEDVAQAVLGFLQNRMVTGECVMVDGGKHLLY